MIAVRNPATEETIAQVPSAGVEETDAAVAAARAAFPAWRAVAPSDRGRLLRRLAALVEEHAEELALLETRNVGKPIADSRGEVGMVAEVFYFYAGAVDKHHGETIPVAGGVDLTLERGRLVGHARRLPTWPPLRSPGYRAQVTEQPTGRLSPGDYSGFAIDDASILNPAHWKV